MSKEEKDKENISDEEEDLEVESSEKKTEEDEEDLEEVLAEDDSYQKRSLNRFLSNPWKQVSLDERNMIPISNLEEDLPEIKDEKKDLDEEKIEYDLFRGIEEGKYSNPSMDQDLGNGDFLSDQEKNLDKMKRLYDNPKKLSSEFEERTIDPMKYVRPEDTKRTDYLLRKKFGDV